MVDALARLERLSIRRSNRTLEQSCVMREVTGERSHVEGCRETPVSTSSYCVEWGPFRRILKIEGMGCSGGSEDGALALARQMGVDGVI